MLDKLNTFDVLVVIVLASACTETLLLPLVLWLIPQIGPFIPFATSIELDVGSEIG